MKIRVAFVPQDLWVGVYVRPDYEQLGIDCSGEPKRRRVGTTLFICLLPCVPIIVQLRR